MRRRTTSVPLISSPCIAPMRSRTGPSFSDLETVILISSADRDGSVAIPMLTFFSSPGRIRVPLSIIAQRPSISLCVDASRYTFLLRYRRNAQWKGKKTQLRLHRSRACPAQTTYFRYLPKLTRQVVYAGPSCLTQDCTPVPTFHRRAV